MSGKRKSALLNRQLPVAIEIVVFHFLNETRKMKNLQFIRRLSDFEFKIASIWVKNNNLHLMYSGNDKVELKFLNRKMAFVTLTSDWNQSDYYIGAMKGKLLSLMPDVRIIDISHHISHFNISEAAFVVKNAYHHFPEGTHHILCINSEHTPQTNPLMVMMNGHYFYGMDNGIFNLIFNESPEYVYRLSMEDKGNSFPEFYDLAEAVAHIANEGNPGDIGEPTQEYSKHTPLRAVIDHQEITGSIVYIDSYQNAITNVTRKLFERIGNGKSFDIYVQSHHYKISKINTVYGEAPPGELMALFNSTGLLEIGINKGNAASLLNLSVGSNVRIKFK